MGSILSITGIKKQFGAHVVLDGIDMELESGKIYHLMGPNGSGKTTLINIISGLFAPDAGRILFNESDTSHKGMLNTYKSGLIRTWQIPQPFSLLTTLENITVSSPKNRGESFLNAVLKSRWRSDEKRITDDAADIMKTATLFEKGVLGV